MDLDRNLGQMTDGELLEYQQEVTRSRLAALEAGRAVQAELDDRAARRAERRAEEDARLGAVTKPSTQHMFGEA